MAGEGGDCSSMAKLLFALLASALLTSSSVAATAQQPEPLDVSVVSLLATPERYDGQRIRTEGFLTVQFENTALWLDRDAWDHGLYRNAIWVDGVYPMKPRAREDGRLSRRYVDITGRFRAEYRSGHMGAYSGQLEQIEKIEPRRFQSQADFQRWVMRPRFDLAFLVDNRWLILGVIFVVLVTVGAYRLARWIGR